MKLLIHKLLILIIANVLYIATVVEAADCPSDGANYDMQKGKLYLPSVLVGHNGSIFEAKLDLLDSQNSFQFRLAASALPCFKIRFLASSAAASFASVVRW